MAGRLTLLKSALDSLPTYWFNLYRIPSSICNEIDKIRRDFLWGWNHEKNPPTRKMHLLKWAKLCCQKEGGGLNISNLDARNIALLGKWWWRWKNDRELLCRRVIRQVYNCDLGSGLEQLISNKD